MTIYQLEYIPENIDDDNLSQLDQDLKCFTFHILQQHRHQHLTHIYGSCNTVPLVCKQHPEDIYSAQQINQVSVHMFC